MLTRVSEKHPLWGYEYEISLQGAPHGVAGWHTLHRHLLHVTIAEARN